MMGIAWLRSLLDRIVPDKLADGAVAREVVPPCAPWGMVAYSLVKTTPHTVQRAADHEAYRRS
jgi:hypothetical protein